MTLSRVVSAAGRLLIGLGVLVLLFVAYQLWGTGLREARAQDKLERQFEELLASTTTSTTTITAPDTTRPPDGEATDPGNAVPAPVERGDALARIVIPRIGLDKLVVEGTSVADLRKGPGHYLGTPLPGQPGNSAIAGHRTTYGAPFGDLDKLQPGDEISVTTTYGQFTYRVMPGKDDPTLGYFIVKPTDVWVLDDFGDNRLTLTACHPKYSARQRIIVAAELVEQPVAPPSTTTVAPSTTIISGNGDTTSAPATPATPDFDEGLGGDPTARTPAILWGAVFIAMLAGVWQASIRWRRWASYAIGAAPLVVVLFFWFEQIDRWLPAR